MFVVSGFIRSQVAWLMPVVCGKPNEKTSFRRRVSHKVLVKSLLLSVVPRCTVPARGQERKKLISGNVRQNFRLYPLRFLRTIGDVIGMFGVRPGGEVSGTAAAAWQRQAEILVHGAALAGDSLLSAVKPKLAKRTGTCDKSVVEGFFCMGPWGLSAWQPTRSRGPLRPGQQRFRVDLEDLPDDIRAASAERHCRAAMYDARTEDTSLEVMLEPEGKWLMNILDQSSSQWGGRCYLSYSSGLRLAHVPDMLHRRSNDCKNALSQVGLNSLRLTACICLNSRMGPWQEIAHHHKMAGILSDYCRTGAIEDPLFVLQYEALSRVMHLGQTPAELGTPEHMWIVFRCKRGERERAAGEATALGAKDTIAKAKTEVENQEKQRSQCKSTIHLMIFFLSNSWNVSLVLIASDFEQVFIRQYVERVERCGSQEGAGDWYADQAKGNYSWLSGMWKLRIDPTA
eukprot:5154491-Amphidinium_carterae.3